MPGATFVSNCGAVLSWESQFPFPHFPRPSLRSISATFLGAISKEWRDKCLLCAPWSFVFFQHYFLLDILILLSERSFYFWWASSFSGVPPDMLVLNPCHIHSHPPVSDKANALLWAWTVRWANCAWWPAEPQIMQLEGAHILMMLRN